MTIMEQHGRACARLWRYGLTTGAIGEKLGLTVGQVASIIHRMQGQGKVKPRMPKPRKTFGQHLWEQRLEADRARDAGEIMAYEYMPL